MLLSIKLTWLTQLEFKTQQLNHFFEIYLLSNYRQVHIPRGHQMGWPIWRAGSCATQPSKRNIVGPSFSSLLVSLIKSLAVLCHESCYVQMILYHFYVNTKMVLCTRMFLELDEIISNLYKSGLTCIVLLTTTKVAFDSIHLKRAYEACCKNRLFAVCLKRLL